MAASSELRTILTFQWKTGTLNQSRTSPVFSLMDVKWHLQLICIAEDYYYNRIILRLITAEKDKKRIKPVLVSTFVQNVNYRGCPHQGSNTNVSSANETIWDSESHAINFKKSDEFQVLCIFHDLEPNPLPPDVQSLMHDFSNMLEVKAFSDAELRCGDQTLPVHKSVLAARSEVFAAMFRSKMAESQSGVIEIQDMDARVLSLFLMYVYSGQIEGVPSDVLPGLYVAGDKYAVHALKKTCSDRMINDLTEENCMNTLLLGDAHSDDAFKNEVISFICRNEKILVGEAWLKYSKEHSSVAVEVYQSFVRPKIQKS